MDKKLDRDLVEWRPEWKGKDLEYYNEVSEFIESSVSVLRSLRETLGLSQAEVAEILATTQSNVSKMEAKSSKGVNSLSRIVRARGGRLKLVAEVGGKEIEFSI